MNQKHADLLLPQQTHLRYIPTYTVCKFVRSLRSSCVCLTPKGTRMLLFPPSLNHRRHTPDCLVIARSTRMFMLPFDRRAPPCVFMCRRRVMVHLLAFKFQFPPFPRFPSVYFEQGCNLYAFSSVSAINLNRENSRWGLYFSFYLLTRILKFALV